jgi:hypothetical protein
MITILAPGTYARKSILTHATFVEHIIMVIKAYGIIILKQSPRHIPYLILFGAPWLLLGIKFSSDIKIKIKNLFYPFVKSILLMGLLILILIFPASFVLYDVPPARALSQVSLLLSIYVSFIFFYMGYKVQLPVKLLRIISNNTEIRKQS